MTAARCSVCGGDTDMSEIANIGKSPARRRPLHIDHADGCAVASCRHTIGHTVCRAGDFDVVVTGPVEIVPGQINFGFHPVRFVELVDGDGRGKTSKILCSGIIEPPEPKSYASLNDLPADVEAVADGSGTRWHRGPDRVDWWWPPWDEYAGDPQTPDDVDPFGPFTILTRFDAGEG